MVHEEQQIINSRQGFSGENVGLKITRITLLQGHINDSTTGLLCVGFLRLFYNGINIPSFCMGEGESERKDAVTLKLFI